MCANIIADSRFPLSRRDSYPTALTLAWERDLAHALIPVDILGLLVLYTLCLQKEREYIYVFVWFCVSALVYVWGSVSRHEKYISRMSQNELLFNSLRDTWAAIHNKCCCASYLISRTPAFQTLGRITRVEIVFFLPGRGRKSVFHPMRCQTHNKVCHSYFRASCAAVDYCCLVCRSQGNAFWGLRERIQRVSWLVTSVVGFISILQRRAPVMRRGVQVAWWGIRTSPIEFRGSCSPRELPLWHGEAHGGIWLPTT